MCHRPPSLSSFLQIKPSTGLLLKVVWSGVFTSSGCGGQLKQEGNGPIDQRAIGHGIVTYRPPTERQSKRRKRPNNSAGLIWPRSAYLSLFSQKFPVPLLPVLLRLCRRLPMPADNNINPLVYHLCTLRSERPQNTLQEMDQRAVLVCRGQCCPLFYFQLRILRPFRVHTSDVPISRLQI